MPLLPPSRHALASTLLLLALSPALAAQDLTTLRSFGNVCTQNVTLPPPAPPPGRGPGPGAGAPPGGFQFPAPATAESEVARLERVAEGIYAVINNNDAAFPDIPLYGGNATIIVTDAGVVLVDARTALMHDDLITKLGSLTDAPIEYLVLTHNHADHSDGAARLQALGATVIATAGEARRMAAAGAAVLPQLSYNGHMQIQLGGTRIELIEFCGHTSADTVVFLPDQRVVISGDLVATPDSIPQITNYEDGGSWTDMALALDVLATLDFDLLVAGHGPVLTKPQFLAHRDKIRAIRNRAQQLVEAGSTNAEITQALAAEFNWGGPGPAAGNVPGMQAEFGPNATQP